MGFLPSAFGITYTTHEIELKLKVYMEKHKNSNLLFKDSTEMCWFELLSHIKININLTT